MARLSRSEMTTKDNYDAPESHLPESPSLTTRLRNTSTKAAAKVPGDGLNVQVFFRVRQRVLLCIGMCRWSVSPRTRFKNHNSSVLIKGRGHRVIQAHSQSLLRCFFTSHRLMPILLVRFSMRYSFLCQFCTNTRTDLLTLRMVAIVSEIPTSVIHFVGLRQASAKYPQPLTLEQDFRSLPGRVDKWPLLTAK